MGLLSLNSSSTFSLASKKFPWPWWVSKHTYPDTDPHPHDNQHILPSCSCTQTFSSMETNHCHGLPTTHPYLTVLNQVSLSCTIHRVLVSKLKNFALVSIKFHLLFSANFSNILRLVWSLFPSSSSLIQFDILCKCHKHFFHHFIHVINTHKKECSSQGTIQYFSTLMILWLQFWSQLHIHLIVMLHSPHLTSTLILWLSLKVMIITYGTPLPSISTLQ